MSKYYAVKLTQRQIDALVSLAELTNNGAALTFADWENANPREMPALRAAEKSLRDARSWQSRKAAS